MTSSNVALSTHSCFAPRVCLNLSLTLPPSFERADSSSLSSRITRRLHCTVPSGSAATTASTYALDRPRTTRHSGRSSTFRRWWLTQNRIRVLIGNAIASRSVQLQIAAHMGTT